MRQKTVPSCSKVSPNIFFFYKCIIYLNDTFRFSTPTAQSADTRINYRRLFQFSFVVLQELISVGSKLKNRCAQCIMQRDKSARVPTTLIHWAVDCIMSSKWEIFWKPLLKSLITYGEVSGPSGGWLLSWTALTLPEHQHTEGIPRLHSLKNKSSPKKKKRKIRKLMKRKCLSEFQRTQTNINLKGPIDVNE